MTVIKKSQMITLIVCTDREFKHRSVNFMNNIAFMAEKISVASIEEAKGKLMQDPRVSNVIIDGEMLGAGLEAAWNKIVDLAQKAGVMILLYMSDDQLAKFSHKEHGHKNIVLAALPFTKPVFNDTFHGRGGAGGSSEQFPFGSVKKKPAASAPAPQAKPKSLSAFEASNHVRETVQMVNELGKDRTKIDLLMEVGQRFNGMMGAFSFLKNKAGMTELTHNSEVIDGIARTYAEKNISEVSEGHYSIVLETAKCSYMVLMQLRDDPDKALPDLLVETSKGLYEKYQQDEELIKRNSQSQSDVDEILEEHDS